MGEARRIDRRAFLTTSAGAAVAAAAWATPRSAHAAGAPVRIALTAAAVRDELPLYDRWAAYLERHFGRPVRFVQRKTYHDVLELLRTGDLDFAWVCSYSFTQAWDGGLVDLIAAPIYRGSPTYRSYLIVHNDDAARRLDDLTGRTFAFTDPDSATGYIIPRAMLRAGGRDPDRFFRRTFFTWDHGQAIEAVAERVADGAAVDSYVWDYLAAKRPQIGRLTRKIGQSEAFGFPPMVARRGIDAALAERFRTALAAMSREADGRRVLDEMMLDGYVEVGSAHYDGVRAAAVSAGARADHRSPSAL